MAVHSSSSSNLPSSPSAWPFAFHARALDGSSWIALSQQRSFSENLRSFPRAKPLLIHASTFSGSSASAWSQALTSSRNLPSFPSTNPDATQAGTYVGSSWSALERSPSASSCLPLRDARTPSRVNSAAMPASRPFPARTSRGTGSSPLSPPGNPASVMLYRHRTRFIDRMVLAAFDKFIP